VLWIYFLPVILLVAFKRGRSTYLQSVHLIILCAAIGKAKGTMLYHTLGAFLSLDIFTNVGKHTVNKI
jgi:hypothetical protein